MNFYCHQLQCVSLSDVSWYNKNAQLGISSCFGFSFKTVCTTKQDMKLHRVFSVVEDSFLAHITAMYVSHHKVYLETKNALGPSLHQVMVIFTQVQDKGPKKVFNSLKFLSKLVFHSLINVSYYNLECFFVFQLMWMSKYHLPMFPSCSCHLPVGAHCTKIKISQVSYYNSLG